MRRRGLWVIAAFAMVLPFVVTETLATALAWISSGVRGLAIVTKRFGLPMRYATRRAQGWHRIGQAWVKPGQRPPNRRREGRRP